MSLPFATHDVRIANPAIRSWRCQFEQPTLAHQ